MENGLSNNTVLSLHKDKHGFLWAGTRNGLNRFDGYLFKIFLHDPQNENSLSNNQINDIKQDSKGNIWIATNNGITKYDPVKNTFKRYLYSPDSNKAVVVIRILVSKHDEIYAALSKGIYFFDRTQQTFYPFLPNKNDPFSVPDAGGMDLEEDPEGNIWVAQWPNYISKYVPKENKFYVYNTPKDTLSPLYHTKIFDITSDKSGNIWMASMNSKDVGVYTLRPKLNLFKKLEQVQVPCYSLAFDNLTNSIWIGTLRDGLIKINLNSMEKQNFMPNLNDENSISDAFLASMYIVLDDNLWVGTKNFGINKLRLWEDDLGSLYELPAKYITSDLKINKLAEDKSGNLWVNSNNGLFCFVNKTNTVREYFVDNSGKTPKTICPFRDGVLASAGNGQHFYVSYKTGEPILWRFAGLELSNIYATYKASNGDLWVCADFGIFCYKEGDLSKNPIRYKASEMDQNLNLTTDQTTFTEYKNKLWVNIYDRLYQIDLKSNDTTKISYPQKNWNFIKLPREPNINSYFIDKDTLYTASNKHLVKISLKNYSITNIAIPWIFPNEVVPVLIPLDESRIIYSTYRGVFTYIHNIKKSILNEFIDISRINPNQLIRCSDHKIYFAVNNGIMSFDPIKTEKFNKQLPQLIITDFYLANRQADPGTNDSPLSEYITGTKKITLSYQHTIFGFEMCLMNFDPEMKNGYQYKLEGFDKEWNHIGKRKVATFTNIPAGKYTFLYKAYDKNGNWSDTKKLDIEITPPFWETWWFRVTFFSFLALLVWSIIQWRLYALKKQKENLEEMVEIRTSEIQKQKQEISKQNEEIMTQNEEIKQQSEQILHQLEQIEKQKELISELYREQTDSIHTAQRIQNAILPPQSLMQSLFPEHFVLYMPKDIVSGDFYWVHQKNEYIYLAAIDCTGHGVAGAFMTLIAHNILKEIIKQSELNVKQLLDELNRSLIEILHQENENATLKDGMDISAIRFKKGQMLMEFASAQHKLFILRNNELITIDGDKNSVGVQPKGKIAQFELKTLHVQPNDTFYLFSDGYPGQFGGTNGEEKLKYGRFRELIHSAHLMPIEKQGEWLKEMLQKWQKDTPQTDDIMILGFKIPS